jgi:hypothetical protein
MTAPPCAAFAAVMASRRLQWASSQTPSSKSSVEVTVRVVWPLMGCMAKRNMTAAVMIVRLQVIMPPMMDELKLMRILPIPEKNLVSGVNPSP